jgi:diguanylate cyclase (GGDEF)-like protein
MVLGKHNFTMVKERQNPNIQEIPMGESIGNRLQTLQSLTVEERLSHALEYVNLLEQQVEILKADARIDPQTRLNNKRGFEEQVDLVLKSMHPAEHDLRSVGHQTRQTIPGAACFLFLDIDKFHDMNRRITEYGGDQVIEQVGQFIQTHIRPGRDIAGRIAGDQFSAFFTGTTAKHILHRFLNAETGMAQMNFVARIQLPPEEEGGDIRTLREKVTFTGGIADLRPGEKLDSAYYRASRIMDALKEKDLRDRIVMCEDYIAPDTEEEI